MDVVVRGKVISRPFLSGELTVDSEGIPFGDDLKFYSYSFKTRRAAVAKVGVPAIYPSAFGTSPVQGRHDGATHPNGSPG